MKSVKVKELFESVKKAMEDGKGDYDVYLVTDDEGNDYRPLFWEELLTDTKEVQEAMEISCSGLSNCYDISKAALLG